MNNYKALENVNHEIQRIQAFNLELLFGINPFNAYNKNQSKDYIERGVEKTAHLSKLQLDRLSFVKLTKLDELLTYFAEVIDSAFSFSENISRIASHEVQSKNDEISRKVYLSSENLVDFIDDIEISLYLSNGNFRWLIDGIKSDRLASGKILKELRGKADQFTDDLAKEITVAKDNAVKSAASVFVGHFKAEAAKIEKSASRWLSVCIVLGIFILGISLHSYFSITKNSLDAVLIYQTAAKLTTIGVLITAALWCGRNYKALMHQAAVYNFKALGLQTVQAFSSGASDPQAKDAVLMETTRSIFSQHQTGYIEDNSGGNTQIIEILKNISEPSSRK